MFAELCPVPAEPVFVAVRAGPVEAPEEPLTPDPVVLCVWAGRTGPVMASEPLMKTSLDLSTERVA